MLSLEKVQYLLNGCVHEIWPKSVDSRRLDGLNADASRGLPIQSLSLGQQLAAILVEVPPLLIQACRVREKILAVPFTYITWQPGKKRSRVERFHSSF